MNMVLGKPAVAALSLIQLHIFCPFYQCKVSKGLSKIRVQESCEVVRNIYTYSTGKQF